MIEKGRCTKRSAKELRNKAMEIRNIISNPTEEINILDVVENVLPQLLDNYEYYIVAEDEWQTEDIEALTISQDGTILLLIPENIYRDANIGMHRARFTIAHEIGHVLLHGEETFALARQENERYGEDKTCDPEWQANEFAAEILCPITYIKDMTIVDIQQKYGISRSVATIQKRKSAHAR